jgi:ribosomal protein S18 acetylase RimI-like enzyme
LAKAHERAAFSCGNDALDAFLKTLAGQYERKGVSRTFVAVVPGEKRVVGYYAAAAGSFTFNSLPPADRKGLPKHPLPTVHLGRLAVDRSCQGRGLGETLLFHFLRKAREIAAGLGVFAVDVWATDDQARAFYLKYGFMPLTDSAFHLYLPLKGVEQMFAE